MRRLITLLICIVGTAVLLWAATAAVVPDGDNTTGSWTTTPLWQSVDEDIDSPDAAIITSPNNPGTPSNDVVFDVTCPSDLDTVTEANLRIRAREQGNSGRTISSAVSWSATTTTDFNTGNLTSTMSNYASGNKTGLNISKATCDASTLKVAPTTAGGGAAERAEIDSFNLDITYTAQTGPKVNKVLISQAVLEAKRK